MPEEIGARILRLPGYGVYAWEADEAANTLTLAIGMAILEGDDWPGNVRELEAVVKRAMVRRRRGWVIPEDIVLPKLRRDRLREAMQALGINVTAAQEQALRLASSVGNFRHPPVAVAPSLPPVTMT